MRLTENNILKVTMQTKNEIPNKWYVTMKSGYVSDTRYYGDGLWFTDLPKCVQEFCKKRHARPVQVIGNDGKPEIDKAGNPVYKIKSGKDTYTNYIYR